MMELRQVNDIKNQHIDILIELKRGLISIDHERFPRVKTLQFTVKYHLEFTKVDPSFTHKVPLLLNEK